jgi:hypothetical protein
MRAIFIQNQTQLCGLWKLAVQAKPAEFENSAVDYGERVDGAFWRMRFGLGRPPGDVAGVTLGVTVTGGNFTLTWSHGTLLQAQTPNGPWLTNTASSPS